MRPTAQTTGDGVVWPTVRWSKAANQAGFECILTRDRLFGESAARALKRFPKFCVVLLTIPQLRGHEFLDKFQLAWERSPIQPIAGLLLRWPD